VNGVAQSRTPATIARHAVRSLHAELMLYPKPGLVSAFDNGSHADMNAETFMRSLFSLRGYFCSVAAAGMRGAGFAELAALGVKAEHRMLTATGDINTHRGGIFILGLLCAAAGRLAVDADREAPLTAQGLQDSLLTHWGSALRGHCAARDPAAHGTRVALVHGAGGARAEAAAGLPIVFDIALPVLLATLQAGRGWECARIDAFFTLMAAVDDTNVYHRGGAEGARLVRSCGQDFMARGGTADPAWRSVAEATHRAFVARRLSPGGCADLLAATCLVHDLTADAAMSPTVRPAYRTPVVASTASQTASPTASQTASPNPSATSLSHAAVESALDALPVVA
jgi:triphosphoribosyl-dephospho-CoA synthase